jgi:hypothetical protein
MHRPVVAAVTGGAHQRARRRLARLALATAVVVAVGVGVAAWSALSSARRDLTRARSDLQEARAAMLAGDDGRSQRALDRASAAIGSARSRAAKLPLRLLRPVPMLGSAASALVDVTEAGRQVVAAGRILVEVRASFPVSTTATLEGRDLSGFHKSGVESSTGLEAAGRHLSAARTALEGPAGALLPPVSAAAKQMRAEIGGAQRELDGTRRGIAVLTHLTGPRSNLRLLVLSQDSLELRPTGGYIGSYGVLNFSLGTVRLERYEATEVLPEPHEKLAPPPDLAPWLPRWWGLSNVNWWPDFPTTARAAQDMFARQGGGEVGGVLAVTEHAVARLIGALGPLQVPGYAEPVVQEGFQQRVLHEVELKRPLDQPRKKFLAELSTVLFERLLDLPAGRLPAVVRAVDHSVGAGDAQLWFADPELQDLVAGTAWSGKLPSPGGDFLMLVDANLSGSKANLDLVKEVRYEVRRRDDGWLRARLELTVRNQGDHHPDLNPYYNGFLRIYLPSGARLPALRSGQRLDGAAPDGDYQVVSQVLDVDPLGRQHVVLDYWLPPSVAPGGRYRLTWVRQAGTPRDTFTVVVGGRTLRADNGDRSFTVAADLRGNRVAEFLRDRWLVRELGDLFG